MCELHVSKTPAVLLKSVLTPSLLESNGDNASETPGTKLA